MPTLEIDYKNFIAGESSADFIADRGFSPDSYNLNLTQERGVVHFQPDYTDMGGAVLTGNIIASANDRNYLGNDKYFLDDEGNFYTLNGATFTKRQTSASAFSLGTSDILQMNFVTYATSADSLHELTGGDLATCERLWGVALTANYRHPLEQIESEMFVGNQNVIYYLTNAGATGTAFTLPPDVNVTSLRKHPDGRTLLAFCGKTTDASHLRSDDGRVYFCDPVIRDWTREVEISSQVEGTRVVGGIVYCTYGNKFGYFNGNGLVFLKKFETSTVTYSHNISNMEDILLVRDGLNVLAFGDLGAGKVWWKCIANLTNTNAINNVSYKGDNVLLIAFQGAAAGTGLLKQSDFDNAGYLGSFYTNKINFGSEVKIRRIDLIHDATGAASNQDIFLVSRDSDGNNSTIASVQQYLTNSTYTRVQCDITTSMFQLGIVGQNGTIGFKLIRIYYDPIK